MFDSVYKIILLSGVVYCFKHVLDLLRGFYFHFIVPMFLPIDLKTRFGPWAVVTGGSSGIGESYARELARRGLDLILISENLTTLNSVASQISTEYKVQVKLIHADLRGGDEVFNHIDQELKNLDIGLLVNNAGVNVPYPMKVGEMSDALIMNHVMVNVAAVTRMCRLVLPGMTVRGRGAIVNLASLTTLGGTPYFAVYAASKAYVESLSSSLQFEYRGSGIKIQALTPTFVNTDMLSFNSIFSRVIATDASKFVRHAVSTVGVVHKTAGYWVHGLQRWMCDILPTRLLYTEMSGHLNEYLRSQYEAGPKKLQ